MERARMDWNGTGGNRGNGDQYWSQAGGGRLETGGKNGAGVVRT